MSIALFDLEPEWTWAPPRFDFDRDESQAEQDARWKPYAAEWLRCCECGTRKKLNMGKTAGHVCEDCALIDGCERRAERYPDECEPGEHISHWGKRHTVAEHAAGVTAQRSRRASYLKTVAS